MPVPLGGTAIETLTLVRCPIVDWAALARIPGLQGLDVEVGYVTELGALIDRVPWKSMAALQSLGLGGEAESEQDVLLRDLDFITELRQLRDLSLRNLVHDGDDTFAPFRTGVLSDTVTDLRIVMTDEREFELLREQLASRGTHLTWSSIAPDEVIERLERIRGRPRWTVCRESDPSDGFGWWALGSLHAEDPAPEGSDPGEFAAHRRAAQRLSMADPELLQHVDLDADNTTTLIRARSETALRAALGILGLAEGRNTAD